MGYPAAKIGQFLDAVEPEVIIECPACQTKFRIEASKLTSAPTSELHHGTGRAKARFHCSRCDYVFAAELSSTCEEVTSYHPDSESQISEQRSTAETEEQTIEKAPSEFSAYLPNFPNFEQVPPSFEPATIIDTPSNFEPESKMENLVGYGFGSKITDSWIAAMKPEKKMSEDNPEVSEPGAQLTFNFETGDIPNARVDLSPTMLSPTVYPPHSDLSNSESSYSVEAIPAAEQLEENVLDLSSENTDPYISSGQDLSVEATRFFNTPVLEESSKETSVESSTSKEVPFESSNQFPVTDDVEATQLYTEAALPWAQSSEGGFSSRFSGEQTTSDFSRYAQDFSKEDEEHRLGLTSGEFATPNPISNSLFSPSAIKSEGSYLRSPRNIQPRNPSLYAVAVFVIPLVLLVTVLGGTTLYLSDNLSASERLLTTLFPSAMREVPSGVFVQEPTMSSITLDSGDTINVISGTVINQSKKTLSAITVEAMGFSDSGEFSVSEKILIGNPVSINNATLKNLLPSEIKELQSKEPKSFTLRPEAKQNFLIVLNTPISAASAGATSVEGQKDTGISSFAVRVHSVRF